MSNDAARGPGRDARPEESDPGHTADAEPVPAALVHADELTRFSYGDDHPFKPIRAHNMIELCDRYGLLDEPGFIRETPVPIDAEAAAAFHDPGYLDLLRRASGGEYVVEMLAHGIGTEDCPALAGIWEFSLLAAGATLRGLDAVLAGRARRAFNPTGGFHHAFRNAAEGFCYVDDVGLAIETVLRRGLRPAYVDIDAHHGNGVQDAFYRDGRVLKISLHETGRSLYPWGGFETEIGEGVGEGFNVNVPLAPRTDDEVYVEAFERIVPPLIDAFRPDVVIAVIGADTHVSDPLTHLRLTANGYRAVVRRLCDVSRRLVAAGGGGYDVFRTARCWTLAWAEMREKEPEDAYAGLVGGMMYGGELDGLAERRMPTVGEDARVVRDEADRVVHWLQDRVFPILGARIA
jgi:acetoin utilization protein AcuC